MNKAIKDIVIVGGGTAGWLTAGTLAAKHHGTAEGITITLVESPNTPIIGVGEGTWPTLRDSLRKMGVSETDFIRECDVSFKQGAKFAQWVDGREQDFYYHPLVLPEDYLRTNLVPQWQRTQQASFSASVCSQEHICEASKAPKLITTPEYGAVANYAYHLNAGKFSQFIKKHVMESFGVKHVLDDMTSVNEAEDGDIASINTKENGALTGDLFIDCTGFRSLLLGGHYQIPFVDKQDVLFIDTAIAVQVPYADDADEIASHTISTAQTAGWIWDIGLSSRRGVGHVYSSKYISDDEAAQQLRDYLTPTVADVDQLTFRKIPIHCGHREVFWHNNCVGVGLAAGFLEPLEASAIVLVELSARMIADQMPVNRAAMRLVAKRFNEMFLYRWDRIVDFLKLHYVLSKRQEPFWQDNRDPASIPESLQALLDLWQYQSPWHSDFTHAEEVFPSASWQYVLYGMGFSTALSHLGSSANDAALAEAAFEQNRVKTEKLLRHLPGNRELITKIHQYGLQAL